MRYELVIVGAGVSGLTSALAACEAGLSDVLIIDHERRIGGFASLLRDHEEFRAERRLMEQADKLPYPIWRQATAVGFFPGENGEDHQLNVQTPTGTQYVTGRKVLLASGALEKPREAHRIAGSRPAGVMTPSMVLNLLERNYLPGQHALLIENGRASRGAAVKLAQAGCRVERLPGEEWEVLRIGGVSRVNEVECVNRATGESRSFSCDTLIFSRGRIPSTFYLKGSPVERNEDHAVIVDRQGKTNIPYVSAAGTCTSRGDDDHVRSMEAAREAVAVLLNG